ncbi:12467_t:CDS:2, partial [Racocetra persica]
MPKQNLNNAKETLVDHDHHFLNNLWVYKCRFHGESAYSTLTQILEDPKWGKKCYDQNQQTYIVLEQLSNTNIKNQDNDDIDPLEQLNNQKKTPKIFSG